MLEREALQTMITDGLSLEAMGRRFGRHASTVAYWLDKHGLEAAHRQRHLPKGGIDRDALAALVDAGLSGRRIAGYLGLSQASVRHWLGVHRLETIGAKRRRALAAARAAGEETATIVCPRCEPSAHRATPSRGFVCLRCRASAVAARRRKVKAILVEEAGGCCARCGFAESLAALQFHHLDPSEKEFHIAHQGVTRSIARARDEARKCILLCANCHAAVECGDAALP